MHLKSFSEYITESAPYDLYQKLDRLANDPAAKDKPEGILAAQKRDALALKHGFGKTAATAPASESGSLSSTLIANGFTQVEDFRTGDGYQAFTNNTGIVILVNDETQTWQAFDGNQMVASGKGDNWMFTS